MTNNVHLLKILLNNLLFFLFSKFLELFFTPKNTPPKSKYSKLDKIPIFLGHPVVLGIYMIYPSLHCECQLHHWASSRANYHLQGKYKLVTYLYIILYFIILGQGYFLIISPLTIHSSIWVYSRMKDCERIL